MRKLESNLKDNHKWENKDNKNCQSSNKIDLGNAKKVVSFLESPPVFYSVIRE